MSDRVLFLQKTSLVNSVFFSFFKVNDNLRYELILEIKLSNDAHSVSMQLHRQGLHSQLRQHRQLHRQSQELDAGNRIL